MKDLQSQSFSSHSGMDHGANMDFPGGLVAKNLCANAGDARDVSLIPGLGSSPGERTGYPLQYSGRENPHGQRSMAGYSPWGPKESDTTK